MSWSSTLASAVGPDDGILVFASTPPIARFPYFVVLDPLGTSEVVAVVGGGSGGVCFVIRGYSGAREAHPAGITCQSYSPITTAPGGGGSVPAGVIVMWGGLVVNIPAGWVLCDGTNGTPDLRGLFVKGASGDPGSTGGAATHTHVAHVVTQPSDHAALAHSGTAVSDHTVTQASAHTNHVFTQPGNHSVTQPAAHSNHAFTQPSGHSAHVVTQPSAHADNIAHTHTQSVNSATTGALSGYTPDTSTSTSTVSGYVTGSSGTGASLTHAGTAVDAHSAHAGGSVDAHSAHSGTATDAHSGGAVDAHSAHSGAGISAHGVTQPSGHAAQSHAGSAVDTHTASNSEPAYYSLAYIQKT